MSSDDDAQTIALNDSDRLDQESKQIIRIVIVVLILIVICCISGGIITVNSFPWRIA